MLERRAERRTRTLKEGKVLLSDYVATRCTIRDLSPGGARIELETAIVLPSAFRLQIVSADVTIPATSAWQRGTEVGVKFTGVGVVGALQGAAGRRATRAA
jgi:hypothetical protein